MTDWTIPSAQQIKKTRIKESQERHKQNTISNLQYFKQRVDDLISAMDSNLEYKCGSGIPKSVLDVIDYKLSDYFNNAPALTMRELLKQKGWELKDNRIDLTLKGIEE